MCNHRTEREETQWWQRLLLPDWLEEQRQGAAQKEWCQKEWSSRFKRKLTTDEGRKSSSLLTRAWNEFVKKQVMASSQRGKYLDVEGVLHCYGRHSLFSIDANCCDFHIFMNTVMNFYLKKQWSSTGCTCWWIVCDTKPAGGRKWKIIVGGFILTSANLFIW